MHWITLVIVTTVYAVYLLLGGAVFMILERERDVNDSQYVLDVIEEFMGRSSL